MIDLIPGVQFSEGEKQIYGSILAALLGALIGTLTSFLIANRERTKQEDNYKIRLNRQHIRDSANGIHSATLTLTDLLIKLAANKEYVQDIQKGLMITKGEQKLALMQLSTPFLYTGPDRQLTETILNDKIITLWGNLINEIDIQNKGISDFGNYYNTLFTTIHTALLRNEAIDLSVVESDANTVTIAMDQQIQANNILRKKAIEVVALIDCFAQYIQNTNSLQIKNLEKIRDYIKHIASYEPDEATLNIARAQAEIEYMESKMFSSRSSGDE